MRAFVVPLALALLLPLHAEALAQRMDARDYVAGSFAASEGRCGHQRPAVPAGLLWKASRPACFDLLPGESAFLLYVNEDGTDPVGGWFLFTDAEGRRIGDPSPFCDKAAAQLPAGAVRLVVVLKKVDLGCPGGPRPVHVPTTGNVTVAFR